MTDPSNLIRAQQHDRTAAEVKARIGAYHSRNKEVIERIEVEIVAALEALGRLDWPDDELRQFSWVDVSRDKKIEGWLLSTQPHNHSDATARPDDVYLLRDGRLWNGSKPRVDMVSPDFGDATLREALEGLRHLIALCS